MTPDIEQLRAEVMNARKAVLDTIARLNSDGTDPETAIEGALVAILQASANIHNTGALVDWLRDAADQVEAFALAQMKGAIQ